MYFVLHVGGPCHSWPRRWFKHLSATRQCAKTLGIKLKCVEIEYQKESIRTAQPRYIFSFPRYKRDDAEAMRIAQAFLLGFEVMNGPSFDPAESLPCLRVAATSFPKKERYYFEEIEVLDDQLHSSFAAMLLGTAFFAADEIVAAAWRITPLLRSNEDLHRAAAFLRTSQLSYWIPEVDLGEAIEQAAEMAPNALIQSRWEDALQNAFKAIEAIVGDPPKDETRFHAKLSSAGLDPNAESGLVSKDRLSAQIRRMNVARDKKSAHESVPNRHLLRWLMGVRLHSRALIRHHQVR